MHDRAVFVVAFARTPFGRFEGALRRLDGARLGSLAMDETLRRAGVAPGDINAVYGGVGLLGGAALTSLRQAILQSGLPQECPSTSVDRACCSGMTAIGMGYRELLIGESEAVLCGGYESLSTMPYLLARKAASRIGAPPLEDPLLLRGKVVQDPIAVYSGEEALRNGVSREAQDEWALQSHERYFAAEDAGFFDAERFAVETGDDALAMLAADESPRRDSTMQKLARLKPVYGGPTVTAGNAPSLSDGASFLLLCTGDFVKKHDLKPLARVLDHTQVCGGPTSGTSTPAVAIRKLAERSSLRPGEWDLIEINEAYAATPLVSTQVLADDDLAKAASLRQRTNVHGGAVALGHPLGASGARLVTTLINGLIARGGGRGVAAICGGFGQGEAISVEVTG